MIELNKLVVGYRNKPVAAPISGIFVAGSLTAIKGANGAGKSTLLKTLCGVQPAVSGEISYEPGVKKNMSWLPQRADIDSGIIASKMKSQRRIRYECRCFCGSWDCPNIATMRIKPSSLV